MAQVVCKQPLNLALQGRIELQADSCAESTAFDCAQVFQCANRFLNTTGSIAPGGAY